MVKKEIKVLEDAPIMPIGSMAEALGIHQRTLRIYDTEGILCPKRTTKNRRYYSLNDVQRAKLILFLTRNLSINIPGVKIIFKMLEENKIDSSKYYDYVYKIAKLADIDDDTQEENFEKNARKGRKAKTEK